MRKSSSSRHKPGLETPSKSERRRTADGERPAVRADPEAASSSSRRRSSRRNTYEDDDDPSTITPSRRNGHDLSQASYDTAFTAEPSYMGERDTPTKSSQKRESQRDKKKESRRDSRDSKYGLNREDSIDGPTNDRKGRRSRGTDPSTFHDTSRAVDHYDASLPQNQFPGEIPASYTKPYRPPGHASDYYGDQGESVAFQPGVRPAQPSIVTNAEQAHLMQPTVDAHPPPEPSSIGQVGAAASYFGESPVPQSFGSQSTSAGPSKRPGGMPSHSNFGASPRTSPVPSAYDSRPTQGTSSIPGAAAVGAAASYYASTDFHTPQRPLASNSPGSGPYSAPVGAAGTSTYSNRPLFGTAAAAGIASAAGTAYLSHQHQEHANNRPYGTPNTPYGGASSQMQHRMHHKHRSPLGKLVDWFRDPNSVAEFEQYTEAIGVCKYCFDPKSSPADAPRRHHYQPRRRSSGSRYGSTDRVDKSYRYSSDEERRKRSKTKNIVVGGLAGYGAAKVGNAVLKANHDFDDTYSVQTGRPFNQSRVSFQEQSKTRDPRSRRSSSSDVGRRRDRKPKDSKSAVGVRGYNQKVSKRRDSGSSTSSAGLSRGAVLSSAAVLPATMALGSGTTGRRRSRSRSPSRRKPYYSKRVSPMHSYVDLSSTNPGSGGIMGFFTSPSANRKRPERKKGFFSLTNGSSSSTDLDLGYGAGTVRRKSSTRRLSGKEKKIATAAGVAGVAGLLKLGNDLASESDRRKRKGKDRDDANYITGREQYRRHATNGKQDEEWYDVDDSSEIDPDLGYGSSLDESPSNAQISNVRHSAQGFDPAQISGNGHGQGDSRFVGYADADPGTSLPALRDLEPRPLSDPRPLEPSYDPSLNGNYHQYSSPQPHHISSTSVPLRQPQPVTSVRPFIDQSTMAAITEEKKPARDYRHSKPSREDVELRSSTRISDEDDRIRPQGRSGRARRDSSPAKLSSQVSKETARFGNSREVQENGASGPAGSARPERQQRKDRRKSADSALALGAAVVMTGALISDSSSKNLKETRSSDSDHERPYSPSGREAEIERQLQALYEEQRRSQGRKRSTQVPESVKTTEGNENVGLENMVNKKTNSEDDAASTPRRKSSLKKVPVDESPQAETQQERIARMAAHRVKSTPSPVYEDYSTFFVPQELTEHLKEHNEQAEHRDDIGATIVEITPGSSKSKSRNPFDPYLYHQFGLHPDDDPTLHPWPVPLLSLVEATPPGSRTHSDRGDLTPVIKPTSAPSDIGEPLERKVSTGNKVTWGDHDTYVYEVQTPEYEKGDFTRDQATDAQEPDDLTDQSKSGFSPQERHHEPRPVVGRTWTLDDTEAQKMEHEVSVVSDRPTVGRAWTLDDDNAEAIPLDPRPRDAVKSTDSVPKIIEIEPKRQEPSIAVDGIPDDERDLGNRAIYRSPFAETVSDLGILSEQQGHSPSLGYPEQSDIPAASDTVYNEEEMRLAKDFDTSTPSIRPSKSDRRRLERASTSNDTSITSQVSAPVPGESDVESPRIPEKDSVFDYLVDGKSRSIGTNGTLALGAAALLASEALRTSSENDGGKSDLNRGHDKSAMFSKPTRANTLDDKSQRRPRSTSKTEYQSDPEEWERTRKLKNGMRAKDSSQSELASDDREASKPREPLISKAPRDSNQDSDDETDDDGRTADTITSPSTSENHKSKKSRRSNNEAGSGQAEQRSSESHTPGDKKSRRKSKRDSQIFDDDNADTRSTTSSSAAADKRRKDKDKKASGGLFSSIFSSSKSDVSTSSKRSSKSSKSGTKSEEGREEHSSSRKKRRSKTKDFDDDDTTVDPDGDREDRQGFDAETLKKSIKSRDTSLDDGFVSAEETGEQASQYVEDDESFLGDRPEMPQPTDRDMPMGTDGVSGLATARAVEPDDSMTDFTRDLHENKLAYHPKPDDASDTSDKTVNEDNDLPPSKTPLRRLSAIRTGGNLSSPATPGQATSIPVHFRLPASSPTNTRGFLSSPVASPSSPLTTPRTRQGRPKSTEFTGKDIRPLYLVERSNFAKASSPIATEYPPLPPSIASSTQPSLEDLRAEAQAQEHADYFTPTRVSAEMLRDRARRKSQSHWGDEETRRQSPDYLDSRSATPVPGEAQRARDSETKPKPKYEFHSPSELLQDPSLFYEGPGHVEEYPRSSSPLPSVISTEADQDYMSARSRSQSPIRARSVSRGRRSASESRSTSASWQDAVSTIAAGAIAGTALGMAMSQRAGSAQAHEKTERRVDSLSDDSDGKATRLSFDHNVQEPPKYTVENLGGEIVQKQDAAVLPSTPSVDTSKASKELGMHPEGHLTDSEAAETQARIHESEVMDSAVENDKEAPPTTSRLPTTGDVSLVRVDPLSTPSLLEGSDKQDLGETPEVVEGSLVHPSNSSAFDEAFAAAVYSRGLGVGTTLDDAHDAFMPEASHDLPERPCTPLTTIAEETETPTPAVDATAEALVQPDLPRESSKKAKKKGKNTSRRSWSLDDPWGANLVSRQPDVSSKSVADETVESDTNRVPLVPPPQTQSQQTAAANPSGSDTAIPGLDQYEAQSSPNPATQDSKQPEQLKSTMPEDSFGATDQTAEANDLLIAPPKTGRRAKKGKKGDFLLWDDDHSAPRVSEANPSEPPQPSSTLSPKDSAEATTDTVPRQVTDDILDVGTAKSKKKQKKDKRKSLALTDEPLVGTLRVSSPHMSESVNHTEDQASLSVQEGDDMTIKDASLEAIDFAKGITPGTIIQEQTSATDDAVVQVDTPLATPEQDGGASATVLAADLRSVEDPEPDDLFPVIGNKKDRKKQKKRESALAAAALASSTAVVAAAINDLADGSSDKEDRENQKDAVPQVVGDHTNTDEPTFTAAIEGDRGADVVEDQKSVWQTDFEPTNDNLPVDMGILQPSDQSVPVAVDEEDQDRLFPIKTKTSKKDRKKSKRMVIDDNAEPSSLTGSDVDPTVLHGTTSIDPVLGDTAQKEQEDLLPLVSKKSKKDKRKNKELSFDTPAEAIVAADTGLLENPSANLKDAEQDEIFPPSGKKSKKDKKKKKRDSTFDDFDNTLGSDPPPALLDEGVASALDSALAVVADEDQARPSQQDFGEAIEEGAADLAPMPTKKSKKGKKKERQILSWNDDERPIEPSPMDVPVDDHGAVAEDDIPRDLSGGVEEGHSLSEQVLPQLTASTFKDEDVDHSDQPTGIENLVEIPAADLVKAPPHGDSQVVGQLLVGTEPSGEMTLSEGGPSEESHADVSADLESDLKGKQLGDHNGPNFSLVDNWNSLADNSVTEKDQQRPQDETLDTSIEAETMKDLPQTESTLLDTTLGSVHGDREPETPVHFESGECETYQSGEEPIIETHIQPVEVKRDAIGQLDQEPVQAKSKLATDVEPVDTENWVASAKKTKKDKKKKRQTASSAALDLDAADSGVGPSLEEQKIDSIDQAVVLEPVELHKATPLDTEATIKSAEIETTAANEDMWPVKSKKSKRDKKKNRFSFEEASADPSEAVAGEVKSLSDPAANLEPSDPAIDLLPQTVTPPENPLASESDQTNPPERSVQIQDDMWTAPSKKKSKKDKRKLQPFSDPSIDEQVVQDFEQEKTSTKLEDHSSEILDNRDAKASTATAVTGDSEDVTGAKESDQWNVPLPKAKGSRNDSEGGTASEAQADTENQAISSDSQHASNDIEGGATQHHPDAADSISDALDSILLSNELERPSHDAASSGSWEYPDPEQEAETTDRDFMSATLPSEEKTDQDNDAGFAVSEKRSKKGKKKNRKSSTVPADFLSGSQADVPPVEQEVRGTPSDSTSGGKAEDEEGIHYSGAAGITHGIHEKDAAISQSRSSHEDEAIASTELMDQEATHEAVTDAVVPSHLTSSDDTAVTVDAPISTIEDAEEVQLAKPSPAIEQEVPPSVPPVEDEWYVPKKSKKDKKKKRASTFDDLLEGGAAPQTSATELLDDTTKIETQDEIATIAVPEPDGGLDGILTKKSKKDKKKKRAPTFDDAFEDQTPASVTAKDTSAMGEEDEQASKDDTTIDPVIDIETTPATIEGEVEPDWGFTKRSKKDKKKNRGTVQAYAFDEGSGTTTFVESTQKSAGDHATATLQDKVVANDVEDFVSTKKSKKDKKKKKQAWLDIEDSEKENIQGTSVETKGNEIPDAPLQQSEQDLDAEAKSAPQELDDTPLEGSVSVSPTPLSAQTLSTHTLPVHASSFEQSVEPDPEVNEPALEINGPQASDLFVEDAIPEGFAVISKKAKKDKKKKRQSTIEDTSNIPELPVIHEAERAVMSPDINTIPDVQHDDQQVGNDEGSANLSAFEPSTAIHLVPQNISADETGSVPPTAHDPLDDQTGAIEHSSEYDHVAPGDTVENAIAFVHEKEDTLPAAAGDQPAIEEIDTLIPMKSSKKDKKDKKKKRQSTIEEPVTMSQGSPFAAEETQISDLTENTGNKTADQQLSESTPTVDSTTHDVGATTDGFDQPARDIVPEQEPEWNPPKKKTKKDKKKHRQSIPDDTFIAPQQPQLGMDSENNDVSLSEPVSRFSTGSVPEAPILGDSESARAISPVHDGWEIPSKKSKTDKKGKKKQQSIDGEIASEPVQSEVHSSTKGIDSFETAVIEHDANIATGDTGLPADSSMKTAVEDEWAIPVKKGKKDKKTKRQSILDDATIEPVPTEIPKDDSGIVGTESPISSNLGIKTNDSHSEPILAVEPSSSDSKWTSPTGHPDEEEQRSIFETEETGASTDIVGNAAVSQSSDAQEDIPEKMPGSFDIVAENSIHATAGEEQPTTILDPEPATTEGRDKLANPEATSAQLIEPVEQETPDETALALDSSIGVAAIAAAAAAAATITSPSATRTEETLWTTSKKTKKEKKKRQQMYDETVLEISESSTPATDEPSLVENTKALDVAPSAESEGVPFAIGQQDLEDRAYSSKKSKKDKKKKRQSTIDDDLIGSSSAATPTFENARSGTPVRDIDPVDEDLAPKTVETVDPADDTWDYSSKKTKKGKKKNKQSGLDDTTTLTEGSKTRSIDVLDPSFVDVQGEQSEPAQVVSGGATDFEPTSSAVDRASQQVGLASGNKKSKKDKKKKNILMPWEDEGELPKTGISGLRTESDTPILEAQDLSHVPEATASHVHEPINAEIDGPQMTSGIDGSARNSGMIVSDEQSSTGAVILTRPPLDEHENEDLHESSANIFDKEAQTGQSGKAKKDKNDKQSRRIFEFNGTETVALPEAELASANLVKAELPPQMGDADLISMPKPAEGSEHREVLSDAENMSDVSATTRERRKRRRSPPVWSGQEPDDLPRSRATTPPPEHDDLMDTALGVAAGLGFGTSAEESTRSARPRSASPAREPSGGWSFNKLGPVERLVHDSRVRDSGVQFESPLLADGRFSSQRDSGFSGGPHHQYPDLSESTDMSLRPPRPQSPTSSSEDVSRSRGTRQGREDALRILETPRRRPSPVDSTSKDRSSVLFNSSPAAPSPSQGRVGTASPRPQDPSRQSGESFLHDHLPEGFRHHSANFAEHQDSSGNLASNLIDRAVKTEVNPALIERTFSPNRVSLNPIREDMVEPTPSSKELLSREFTKSPAQLQEADSLRDVGMAAAIGVAGLGAIALLPRDAEAGHAKSLGRSKSRTSSLRNLRANAGSPHDGGSIAADPTKTSVNDSITGAPATLDRDMADVYDGYGSYPGSPRSPTRPQSVRRRQSTQQIKDLESRLDQLANENRALAEAKLVAEQHLEAAHFERNRSENTNGETLRANVLQLQERDAEISSLRQQVASLIATHENLRHEHERSLEGIRAEHDEAEERWRESSRELEILRSRHAELSQGMEGIVQQEIDIALAQKNAEIQQLRGELDVARQKIQELQSQILAQGNDQVLTVRDEDYFDTACQQLCQQVQGWVLRFSKYSDNRVCRSTNEVRDEKIVDRFDNAILDGSDVDNYLADRVKRRDVFMSVVMTMIWEYVFTRYLFGMDRSQRQKLKELEKNLSEVGPVAAVHQWRALTLTLLSKRDSFKSQRDSDAEAVSLEIFSTLARFLPPPQNLEGQIVGTLRSVMNTAVNLSIEMRTQRAEYIMLPPLQPEYDTNGDLARNVYFNASLMNERSGETTSNDELERSQAVVRMVLFPLVVKKGDDLGVGDEEIVVCPAQVLIARPDKGKKPRGATRIASGDSKSLRAVSTHSLGAMSGIDVGDNMI